MMVKKFIADSYYEAFLQAQAELGEDALILTSRILSKSTWGGLYSQEMVEITAATPNPKNSPEKDRAPARPMETQEIVLREEEPRLAGRTAMLQKTTYSPGTQLPPADRAGRMNYHTIDETCNPDNITQNLIAHNFLNPRMAEMRSPNSIRSMQEGDSEPSSQKTIEDDERNTRKIQALLDVLCKQKAKPPEQSINQTVEPAQKPELKCDPVSAPDLKSLEAKVASISTMLQQILQTSNKALDISVPSIPEGLFKFRKLLADMETPEEVITEMIARISDECPPQLLQPASAACRYAAQWLGNVLRFSPEPTFNPRLGPKVFILIGSTGVGKTTTIAKLAASFALNVIKRKSVALFTLDTFRIGAPAQLAQYAQIIEADMEIILEPEDIPTALERHRKKDVILVDTAGRCQKNKTEIEELKHFVGMFPTAEKYLVLSATTKFSDMLETLECFKIVGFDHLIFTKIDETNSLGPLMGVLYRTNSSLAFITNGQIVPDDFKTATPELFQKAISENLSG